METMNCFLERKKSINGNCYWIGHFLDGILKYWKAIACNSFVKVGLKLFEQNLWQIVSFKRFSTVFWQFNFVSNVTFFYLERESNKKWFLTAVWLKFKTTKKFSLELFNKFFSLFVQVPRLHFNLEKSLQTDFIQFSKLPANFIDFLSSPKCLVIIEDNRKKVQRALERIQMSLFSHTLERSFRVISLIKLCPKYQFSHFPTLRGHEANI